MYGCEEERNRVNCGKRGMAVDVCFRHASSGGCVPSGLCGA